MTSALRLAISLVLSLVLWLCTLPSAMAADAGPEEIALRYLAALLVARVGVGLFFRVVRGYAEEILAAADAEEADAAATKAEEDAAAAAADAPYGRRRTDYVPPEAELSDEQLLDGALDDAHQAATLVSEPAS